MKIVEARTIAKQEPDKFAQLERAVVEAAERWTFSQRPDWMTIAEWCLHCDVEPATRLIPNASGYPVACCALQQAVARLIKARSDDTRR